MLILIPHHFLPAWTPIAVDREETFGTANSVLVIGTTREPETPDVWGKGLSNYLIGRHMRSLKARAIQDMGGKVLAMMTLFSSTYSGSLCQEVGL